MLDCELTDHFKISSFYILKNTFSQYFSGDCFLLGSLSSIKKSLRYSSFPVLFWVVHFIMGFHNSVMILTEKRHQLKYFQTFVILSVVIRSFL